MKTLSTIGYIGLIVVIIAVCIQLTAMLTTAVVVGFFGALGLFLCLGNSPKAMAYVIKYKALVDLFLFVAGLVITFTMGVTFGVSMVFFGIFVTLMLKVMSVYTS